MARNPWLVRVDLIWLQFPSGRGGVLLSRIRVGQNSSSFPLEIHVGGLFTYHLP